MRALIKEYFKFRKAGFFKSSLVILVIILLPSLITLVFNSLIDDELPAILYALFTVGDVFLAVFGPLIVVANYSLNKYKLYITLPIKYDNLFKFIYLEAYAIIIIAFVITGVINFISYDIYSLFVQIFKMVMVLCLCNVFIPQFATESL
jgi:cytochrome c oxidase subunit IV